MALQDIMPYDNPHGGHCRIMEFRLNASETFLQGEPVAVNADGELTESADDPVDADLLGIAATGGDTTASTGSIDPNTGNVITTGGMVKVYMPDANQTFITSNFSSAGSAFGDAAPAVANLGDEAGLSLISGSWGIDISATNNLCRIVDILDADGASIQRSGGTGTKVVFVIVAHQNNSLGTADAPAA